MSNNSVIILENQTYNSESSIIGEKFKGDGYYGRSDGLHSVQIDTDTITAKIKIQATLAVEPADTDWFDVSLQTTSADIIGYVDTTGAIRSDSVFTSVTVLDLDTYTNIELYNFIGNYVWVRAVIEDWSAGTLNSIRINN